MGRFEQRPENLRKTGGPSGDADTTLRVVKEELQVIQRTLLKSLQEDVRRLQIQKDRLVDDIQQLQIEKDDLQRGRQINEQQALVRQLGQVLANHISSQLHSSLEKLAHQGNHTDANGELSTSKVNEFPKHENVEQILGTLDDTLTVTIHSLQQELKNYQNSLSQQLSRMQNQQQQGELILVELVNRLHKELEKNAHENSLHQNLAPDSSFTDMVGGTPTVLQPDLPLGGTPTVLQPDEPTSPQVSQTQLAGIPTEIQPDEPTPQEAPASTPTSKTLEPAPTQTPTNSSLDEDAHSFVPPTIFPRPGTASPLGFTQVIRSFLLQPQGLFLITLSTLISSVYNVAIRVMFQPASQILGIFEVEQLILPTLGNSLLILMLRMLVVMPLMLVLAPILHPRVWLDLQSLLDAFKSRINKHNKDGKKALLLCILGGVFLFLSQILLYIAIGQVSVGMAIALFFIYPTISSLLSWFLLRDFPTPFRAITISTIFLGELLVLGGVVRVDTGNIFLGSLSAIAGGAMFAFYVVITRICSTKVHPVTFTLINFATMLFLCFTGLMVLPFFPVSGLSLQVNTNKILELILTAFILGMLTLCGYLFNNFGIRKLGASRSAIIGALVPVITVVFAGIVIQESLQPLQILGILLLTFGAAAVSFEKIRNN